MQGEVETVHQRSAELGSRIDSQQERVQTMEAAVDHAAHEAECCQVISKVKLTSSHCRWSGLVCNMCPALLPNSNGQAACTGRSQLI